MVETKDTQAEKPEKAEKPAAAEDAKKAGDVKKATKGKKAKAKKAARPKKEGGKGKDGAKEAKPKKVKQPKKMKVMTVRRAVREATKKSVKAGRVRFGKKVSSLPYLALRDCEIFVIRFSSVMKIFYSCHSCYILRFIIFSCYMD